MTRRVNVHGSRVRVRGGRDAPKTYGRARALTERLEQRLTDSLESELTATRRSVLGSLGLAGGAALAGVGRADSTDSVAGGHDDDSHGNFGAVGEYADLDFDAHDYLTRFNTGQGESDNVPQDVYEEDGRTVREFTLTAVDTTITIAPGIEFSAWAYNGQVPGPTLRAVEGDLIRLHFENLGRHAHTIRPHLRNPNPAMDGVPTNGPGVLDTGESYTYEWVAQPAGCQFYHCHSLPLKEHIHRGLYGAIIVDPDPDRVASLVALGIGLHNLAEGLAIGSAFALGRVSLGAFLVIGFMLHNVTEGPAVVAPLARDERPPLAQFVGLGALFLAVGVGAILQVVWEFRGMIGRRGRAGTALNILTFLVGLVVMYATDLLVAI